MSWIQFGVRRGTIFQKSLKIQAWSKGLKKELGWGYTEFITTKNGSQYVNLKDDKKIVNLIETLVPSFKYLDLMEQADTKILAELKGTKINYLKVLDLLTDQLTYFYLARENVDRLYKNPLSTGEDRKKIERWRNSSILFKSDHQAFVALSKKLGIPGKILDYLTVSEVKKALAGEIPNLEQIKKRSDSGWSVVLKNGQIKLNLADLSPIKQSQNKTKEIRGQTVFKLNKKIKGIVGQDILVTHMTHPGMVVKMKQMKAVITDEGGLLSHAAIFAREFKIPTIIGTKIATSVLKKGDLIKVDANNGVVRILK